jgi:hypothetical protein
MALMALDLAIEAGLGQVDLEVLGDAPVRILEGDVDLMVVVRPADGTSWALTKTPTEHLAEDVVHVGSLGWPVGASKPVEILLLLGIGQNIVGPLNLFELFSIPGWFVRVMLKSEFPIGLLDLILGGAPLEP